MGAAVTVILMKERRMVEAFERAGATTAASARAPSDLGVPADGIGWRRLHERAVVRETSPGSGLYYLDEEVWAALRRMRRRLMFGMAIIALALLLFSLGVLRT